LVRAPGIGDAGKTLKAVADDSTVRIEAALGEPCNRSGTEAGDPAQLQSNGFPSAVVSTAATNGVFDGMGCMPMSVGDEEHHCAEW